jgi:hypothetical protein
MYMLTIENKLLDKTTQIVKNLDDLLLQQVSETLDNLSSQVPQNQKHKNGQAHLQITSSDLLDRIIATMQKLPKDLLQKFCEVIVQCDMDLNSPAAKTVPERKEREIDESEETLEDLELWYLRTSFADHQKMLATSYSEDEVIDRLGKTTQSLDRKTLVDRIEQGSLLAVSNSNNYRFPKWQFDQNGTGGVLNGLAEVVKNLNCSDTAKVSWFENFNLELSGATPLDLLKNGHIDIVVRAAKIVGIQLDMF